MTKKKEPTVVPAPIAIWRGKQGLQEIWLVPSEGTDALRTFDGFLSHGASWQESFVLVDLKAAYARRSKKEPLKSEPKKEPPFYIKITDPTGTLELLATTTPLFPGEVSEERQSFHRRLLRAWDGLAAVEAITPAHEEALWLLLRETIVPTREGQSITPLLEREMFFQPPRFPATVAHPRGYHGTKEKSPRPKSLQRPLDLRPYLCCPQQIKRLTEIFGLQTPHRRFTDAFFEEGEALALQRDVFACVPEAWELLRPVMDKRGRAFLPTLLRGLGEKAKNLLPKLIRLWLEAPPQEALAWSRHLLLSTEKEEWIDSVLYTSAFLRPFQDQEAERFGLLMYRLEEFCLFECSDDEYKCKRLRKMLLVGWRVGFGLPSLEKGFLLAFIFRGILFNYEGLPNEDFAIEPLLSLCLKMKEGSDHFYDYFPLRIWTHLAFLPDHQTFFKTLQKKISDPEILQSILGIALPASTEDTDKKEYSAFWPWWSSQLLGVAAYLDTLPKKSRMPLFEKVRALYWEELPFDEFRTIWPRFWDLLKRLGGEITNEGGTERLYISALTILPEKEHALFLDVPLEHFLAFEKACSSRNRVHLYNAGLRLFLRSCPTLALSAWQKRPRLFLRLLGILGCLDRAYAKNLLLSAKREAWFSETPAEEKLDPLLCSFFQSDPRQIPALVPRKIRLAYLAGDFSFEKGTPTAAMRSGQIDRARRFLLRHWVELQLRRLEGFFLTQLFRGFQADVDLSKAPAGWKHALLLRAGIWQNRRPFQKFLRAWLRGEEDYLVKHPANQAWLAKHQPFSLEAWTKGQVFAGEIQPFGPIQIQIETNPFDILQMGTLFGTCLGLGGCNDFAAVTALLDLNKQVLYARDVRGRIIGRQLVAITDSKKLICFPIYSHATEKASLEQAFAKADLALASRIGLPLYKDGEEDDSYKVSCSLSEDWYDDGAWTDNSWKEAEAPKTPETPETLEPSTSASVSEKQTQGETSPA